MKKILVIEDEQKLIKIVGDYFIAFMPNLFGDVAPRAYAELQGLVVGEFFKHELKDVVKFKTIVKVAVTSEKKKLHQMISLPPDKIGDLKYGDPVQAFIIKQKEKGDKRKT